LIARLEGLEAALEQSSGDRTRGGYAAF
jgi:hypothetical protein